ncbi:MAG: sulfotransferase [Flavobacteriaceae bacterium]|nr:sulfotransferase [Flavobacteriaceae bacterium]
MILIGGSGSSGSTMLIRKLNNHPDIFGGGEISFFNKERLFEDWQKNKLKILPYLPYFTTSGWYVYRRSMLTREEYGWNKKEVKNLLKQSNSIVEFSKHYFKRGLDRKNAKIWIEKTPSNAYSFKYFLEQFPEGKVIHITRNPIDSVASMYEKGVPIFYSVGAWLYNNAAALVCENSKRYLRVRYEDIVDNPEIEFKKLLDFIKIENKGLNLSTKEKKEVKDIESWKNSPDGEISKSSMGRFYKLPVEIQKEIYTALHCIQISKKHISDKNFKYSDFDSISKKLGYETKLEPDLTFKGKIKKELKIHKLERSIKMYYTGGNNFPIQLKK